MAMVLHGSKGKDLQILQGVRNVSFPENLTCFVFVNIRSEIRPFALVPTN